MPTGSHNPEEKGPHFVGRLRRASQIRLSTCACRVIVSKRIMHAQYFVPHYLVSTVAPRIPRIEL